MNVSIVIPVFNNYNQLHQLLFDLYQQCNSVNEVVVVNDASTDETVYSGLSWWKTTGMLPIREIRSKENRGFLRTANIGLKRATGDVLILISTDVRVKGDIIQEVLKILNADDFSLVGGVYYEHDTGWNRFGKSIYPYLEGWLLAANRNSWETLGYFDTRYVPNDFEDVDLSTNARQLGMSLKALPPGMAFHIGGQSIGYNPERETLTKSNQKKFQEKWVNGKD